MRNRLFIAISFFIISCTPSITNIKRIHVCTNFFSLKSEQYVYIRDKYILYINPILEFNDSLVNHEGVPPTFDCVLEETNNATAVATTCNNGYCGEIKRASIDTLLNKIGTLYSRDKEAKSAFDIYDGYKIVKTVSKYGQVIETLVPSLKNLDCDLADTIYVTYNKKYNWITKISLSNEEEKRGIKISSIHRIFNERYCSEYKQYVPRRFLTFSLRELPIKNPAKIDSIFAKLIPYLPKK